MAQVDYLSILNQAWADALAPREPNAPTVISTFAGGGGSSTGYHMAGFRELLAVEWDANAVQTLRANYPHLDIYHGDIAKLTVDEVLRRTGLQVGELDIFDGSPPCQGFSTAGKRVMDDPRNGLFKEYVRLLRGLKPKVFVMENVSGMVKGKMKLLFVEILKELKASGYKVSARLLNAMYFHVPQSRERMIFIGVREDLGIEPTHPKAQTIGITVADAWENINDVGEKVWIDKYKIGELWKQTQEGRNHDKRFSLSKLGRDKPSPTITKMMGNEQGRVKYAAAITHPTECRYPTILEVKRLSSFPDSYLFEGTFSQQWERIGNSVPPLFMRAIARHIRENILDCIIK